MPSDPYSQTAKLLDKASSAGMTEETTPRPSKAAPTNTPMAVVGKKYMDPQSRSDEEYMEGAQRGINKRLSEAGERLSGEYRSRRYNDRRYGRRNGR